MLLTGAAGFIGSHAAEGFQEAGYEVTGVENYPAFPRLLCPLLKNTSGSMVQENFSIICGNAVAKELLLQKV